MNKHFYIGLLLILFEGVSFLSFGQNFQNIYRLDAQTTLFNAVKCEQGEFYISGSFRKLGNNYARSAIYKVSELGELISLDTFGMDGQRHLLGFSHSELQNLNDTCYLTYYVSTNLGDLEKETILIRSKSSQYDTLIINSLLSDSGIRCVNGPDSYLDTLTNNFYFQVLAESFANGNQTGAGIMLAKMNKFLEINWRKFLFYAPGRYYSTAGILGKEDRIEAVYSDMYFAPTFTGSNSKVHFVELDTNGTILRDRIFQPHTFTQAASGVKLVNNGQNYLMTYSESKQAFYAGQNTVIIQPILALLDTTLNVVWKDSISLFWWGAVDGIELRGISPKDFVTQDSNFVFAHSYPYGLGMSDSIPFTCVLLENRKLFNGKTNWNRSYQYYKDTNFNNQPHYEIYDASFVPWDSGYVFVGTSYNRDSSSAGVPGQLGYVLKTNCLGHLGDPIAGASFTYNDSLGVHFESTSIQDGGVTWYFGDGSIENRGEYQDSVFHQYDSSGSQEVMLVAHGCLGVKDTLRFTIEIPEYIEPSDSTEGPEPPTVVYTKTLAIAPNPTIEGEPLSVYLGDLPDSGATLVFMDQNGKQIQKFYFPSGQSMYMLPLSLAAGVYELVLLANGEVLDKERLVVR